MSLLRKLRNKVSKAADDLTSKVEVIAPVPEGWTRDPVTGDMSFNVNDFLTPEQRAYRDMTPEQQKEAQKALNAKVLAENTNKIKNQILAQGTTDRWSGDGFGSTDANANAMAAMLAKNGINDIRQFGRRAVQVPNTYTPETKIVGWLGGSRTPTNPNNTIQADTDGENNITGYYEVAPTGRWFQRASTYDGEGGITGYTNNFLTPEQVQQFGLSGNRPQTVMEDSGRTEFFNKGTGQKIEGEYAFAGGDIWSGTFAGKDSTAFGVQFDQQGNPYFYTTQGRGSSDKKTFATLAGIGLMFVPGMQGIGASLGATLAPTASLAVQAGIGNAIVQGVMSEATGGDFLKGAALSGVGSLAGGLQPGLSEALGGGATGNIAADALIGGGISKLSGGDFIQGALMSGIGSGINQAKLSVASDYLDSLPGGHGEYSDAPPDMSDFDLPSAVIDTSFTPDYSLFSGAPVIPDMGAQGIQVPTINEIVDVVNQPVDYSLPVSVGSGLGFQMPTVPNLDAMGGGQGITIPVSGGTLTEAGVIPDTFAPDLGDPTSFINQPAPDVSVNIPELPAATPKNIDAELGLLNAAQSLTPLVVGSLLANQALNRSEDAPTGFAIVPIPTDWRSPEYNMAFTPSAPIDFGSRAMLQGTQFANPPGSATPSFYNLSDVINALNFQSVPFTQQQTQMSQFQAPTNTGMDNIIGEINGLPMSLNSIIAGIQSQYGQET